MQQTEQPLSKTREHIFVSLCLGAIAIPLLVLIVLIGDVVIDGAERIGWDFLTGYPSRKPELAGILPALVGSVYVIGLTGIIALPLGVGAAIYLEEYGTDSWLAQIIEVNIANLAGVPSIIYGLLGLELFVRASGMGRSVIAGACTMALLILPIIIIASREALRTVPFSLTRGGAGAGRVTLADHLAGRPAHGLPWHPDRLDPGDVAGDWRNSAADYDGGANLHRLPANRARLALHRTADPDFQLGLSTTAWLHRRRGGRHYGLAGDVAAVECPGHLPPQPLAAAHLLSSTRFLRGNNTTGTTTTADGER